MHSSIPGKAVLVSGAGGGIGQALVRAFLEAGAAQVFAAARTARPGGVAAMDPRIVPLALDVTRPDDAAQAATRAVDIVVNNAGFNGNAGLFEAEAATHARREIEVNYLGLLTMVRAFAPAMKARGHGTLVQILSFTALAQMPTMAGYGASKAAAHALVQVMRAELAPFGVRVVAVYPTVVDTAMSAHLPIAKMAPDDVARAVVEALDTGEDEVFPGPAAAAHRDFLRDPLAVQRQRAARLPASTRAELEAVSHSRHSFEGTGP